MAFSAPNVFVANTPMTGATLSANNTALRTYLNVGIVQADITKSAVSTTDIVRGEFYNVTPDHQFTSGDMYTQFVDLLRVNERYFSSHIKPYDLTGATPYQIMPESGKRIVLERPADVLFSVGYLGIGDPNYQLQAHRLRNPGYVGHTTGDVLRTSDIELCTAGHSFTEDDGPTFPTPSPTAFVVQDSDNSGNITFGGATTTSPGGYGLYSRRWYCQRIGFTNLPAGIHHFYVAINPRCDKGHIKVLTSEVEVFHRKAAQLEQG
jgi:hypothetical protein